MYGPEQIRGNFSQQRSVILTPGQTKTIISETDFGRAVVAAVTGFANYSNDDASWGDVEFQILLDGIPHQEYGSFFDSMGSTERLREMPNDFVRAASKIEVVAVHRDTSGLGNTYKIGAILQGDYVANS